MTLKLLVLYGSYRSDRAGIRLASYAVRQLSARGHDVDLVDAKVIALPMLDRMFKEYDPGSAPEAMTTLAKQIRGADGFVFVVGEYNWGIQPGLKNLTDHYLEEWYWRPAAILSYSAGRIGGARSCLLWHGTLSEMGTVVISSTIAVGGINGSLDASGMPTGEGGRALTSAFPRFAADMEWWAQAAKQQRLTAAPPY
jgi:NAD(P)H-dependent FMN reductase